MRILVALLLLGPAAHAGAQGTASLAQRAAAACAQFPKSKMGVEGVSTVMDDVDYAALGVAPIALMSWSGDQATAAMNMTTAADAVEHDKLAFVQAQNDCLRLELLELQGTRSGLRRAKKLRVEKDLISKLQEMSHEPFAGMPASPFPVPLSTLYEFGVFSSEVRALEASIEAGADPGAVLVKTWGRTVSARGRSVTRK